MKRFLCAGEGYGLSRGGGSQAQPQMDKVFSLLLCTPKVIGMLLLVAFFCFFSADWAVAQGTSRDKAPEVSRVSAGQRVPEEFWTKEFQFYDHEKVYTQTLEQYRGKPIILAFWSIYCGSCISSFPLLNESLVKYGDDLAVLPVNSYDMDLTVVGRVMGRFDDSHRLTGIMFDDYLRIIFPHGPIPHYVWIRPNGTVGAITVKSFLTMDNISKFVK